VSRILPSDVTVISVCYKSDSVIGDMINSVPSETPVILIDNGGTNRFDSLPPERTISIFKLDKNEGFGRGCNAGAAEAKTPWLLFLNPDARLETCSLDALLDAPLKYPEASAFNPRIANGDGSAYFKRRSYLLPRWEHMKRGWPQVDCRVPVLSGAAIFISKDVFNTIGGFDPNIFLYHEDDDISLRLRKLGPLMFVREALVFHASGNSSGRSPEVAYFKAYHMAQSRIYAGAKHRRPFPNLHALIQCGLLFISPLNVLSRRRRYKTLGFFAGFCSMKKNKNPK
jgi:N-acetylglucosaminyl-diphospho-decaprenol L-rhamnosyltransferase